MPQCRPATSGALQHRWACEPADAACPAVACSLSEPCAGPATQSRCEGPDEVTDCAPGTCLGDAGACPDGYPRTEPGAPACAPGAPRCGTAPGSCERGGPAGLSTTACAERTVSPWTPWSRWTPADCAGAAERTRTRTRTCTPGTEGEGNCETSCAGVELTQTEKDTCKCEKSCTNAKWPPWGPWSGCGGGERSESRTQTCEPGLRRAHLPGEPQADPAVPGLSAMRLPRSGNVPALRMAAAPGAMVKHRRRRGR